MSAAAKKSVIELRHPSGSRAEVYLYGATVTSFYAAQEPERNVLFLSKQALLDGSKPIRGGIPLVFPVFGSAPGFPNHGFARVNNWKLSQLDQTVGDEKSPTVATFALSSSDETKAMYPFDLELVYEVKLFANTLATAIHVHNKSEGEIAFQALLHTYLSADEVRDGGVTVEGLQGLQYHDKVAAQEKTEERQVLDFTQETDSVYANAPSPVVVRMKRADGREQVVTIEKSAFIKSGASQIDQESDVVVWNPWTDKAKAMGDFGDDEYPTMLCVEPGRVSEQQKLPAGQTFTLQQAIKLSALDIVGANASNQEGPGSDSTTAFGRKFGKRVDKKAILKAARVVVPEDELERIKAETQILTPADIEALEAQREADQEHQRLTSKARKEHMLKLSEEAALRAPKSEIEQILSAEKHEVLRRARALKDQTHDSVKLMKTLGTRAQAFTIRDQQLQVKKELEDEHHLYDGKMNMLMEIERLESLKRQEHRDEVTKQKRYADRKVLEDQIEGRRQQRQKEDEIVAQEAQEMLAKIKQQQEEAVEKERMKALRAQRSMGEIIKFNEETLLRKQEVQRKIKEEDDQVMAYQLKKAEDLKRQEEEEAQRRHEAELRCAKLRSMQEKMANEKAELDELRAKRAAEARERQAREADLALARKHKEEMEELRRAREQQALHRERARVKEATLQQHEYESIMGQVESDKTRVRTEAEKRKIASMEHRRVLQSQIEEKEKLKKLAFVKTQEEGQALKEEFAHELEKLERIRLEEVGELVEAGVNVLYLSEMKALDIEKIRNR
ncbi:hypothetical protein BBO99_00000524 [Phytophthora kernoviae]|uniref:Cilia- and flagella-associated protein 45 n=2 Tax=Phytophthora kernoviae TaxID=325452 RepID=A0A3R7I1T6_9STRA|nr:hypothetical protein G195_001490 [Phytophthora kernoviae 00238/432]KAG2532094.1 hypothetical protein JM16_000539 [Phytophthora kernoviae]KAG2533150.1 hypothetical protein JM18_000620 [Phytophthora kernoviae]RLN26028.1 hypothetical protein BBI17_000563 [Phytophthora kernoviae]RLN85469.1 hypothetical protein BBO99_00000524 [Phytophthora kernoviae]